MKKVFKTLVCTAAAMALAAVSTQALAKPIVVKMGYENNPGEPFDDGCRKWAELVEQKSGGSMKVELYPSSQLGSKNDIIDSMILGQNTATLADGAFYADRGLKDFGIVFGPHLFDTWEQAYKLAQSRGLPSRSRRLKRRA